jgi:hypothetical protein
MEEERTTLDHPSLYMPIKVRSDVPARGLAQERRRVIEGEGQRHAHSYSVTSISDLLVSLNERDELRAYEAGMRNHLTCRQTSETVGQKVKRVGPARGFVGND